MADRDGAAVARELFDAMSSHDLDRVASLASDDVRFADVAAGQEIRGREAWRQYCATWLRAFPDIRIDLASVAALGDSAVAEGIARGTQTGPLESPAGEIPPTGRTIEERFCVVIDVRDGELVDGREYYDAMTLMSQLGLMPEPAST